MITTYITSAVESVVQSAIGDLNEIVLDSLPIQLCRIHEIGSTHSLSPRLFVWVGVDGDDARGTDEVGCLYYAETNAAASEDGDS